MHTLVFGQATLCDLRNTSLLKQEFSFYSSCGLRGNSYPLADALCEQAGREISFLSPSETEEGDMKGRAAGEEKEGSEMKEGKKQEGEGEGEGKSVEKSMPAEERKSQESRQEDKNLSRLME